jgi:hypothetical protein
VPSYHNVNVEYENGDIRSFQVRDVNHWESGICELVFLDGTTKVIKKYVEFSMSPPIDEETNEPLDTIREV